MGAAKRYLLRSGANPGTEARQLLFRLGLANLGPAFYISFAAGNSRPGQAADS